MKKTLAAIADPLRLAWWQHGAVSLATFALLVTRRPDVILNPQFYAEDGRVFFQDAYNLGWHTALIQPYGGYFHAVPRLGAALALLAPLALAPLVLNLIALGFEVLPVNLLLSSRSAVWGSFRTRALMAGLYVALPNCAELFANITNVQCSLALIAFLLLTASPPESSGGWLAESLFLGVFGLSGPYCIFLLPVAFILGWKRKDALRWLPLAILTATALIEGWSLLILDRQGRHHYILGASSDGLTRILAGQVYFGALLGPNAMGMSKGMVMLIVRVCIAVIGTSIVVACFLRSSIEMRCVIAFACIVFAASLVSPMLVTPPGQTLWGSLAYASEEHYWFFPILAFVWSLVQCTQQNKSSLKSVAVYLLCLMCIGIIRDWRRTAFKDLHFAQEAKRFEALPAGTAVSIPENPEGWHVYLTKH